MKMTILTLITMAALALAQHDHGDHGGGEPVRYVGAQNGGVPQRRQRHERREHRGETGDVVRPDVAVDDRALQRFQGVYVRHDQMSSASMG